MISKGRTRSYGATAIDANQEPKRKLSSPNNPKSKKDKVEYWKECHKKFVESHPNSIGITASGCHHYIWLDNPNLIITTVSNSYAETLEEKQKNEVYQRALNYAIASLNKVDK